MSEKNEEPQSEEVSHDVPVEQCSETFHSVVIEGKEISYKATAGTVVLKDEKGDPKASIFYMSYRKEGVTDPSTRPICFSFNGGPGSSSVWLHLGLLGPRRVEMGKEGDAPPPPYKLVDNEYSLLDQTDLVFIDPVSTGYSRPVPGEKAEQFHGLEEDLESVGEFIRIYVSRQERWLSPKFIIGESYGTTRAAGLSNLLQNRHGMFLNGIMLVSSVLNFQTLKFDEGNDLPYLLILPTYCATAWYHKKLCEDLQKDLKNTLREAKKFSFEEYNVALMKGALLSPEEIQQTAQKLSRYTGLSVEYLIHCNLRVEINRFAKELLRKERKTVGRLDSRFTGMDRDAAGERFEYDPSYSTIQGPFTAALNDYVRRELSFQSDFPYEILKSLHATWSYKNHQNKYVDVSNDLRGAICSNPDLKVFVANGYFDLATPFFATEYTIHHLNLETKLQKNITMTYYQSGHMMYIQQETLKQMKQDLVQFLQASSH